MSVFGVILVRIFPAFSAFGLTTERYSVSLRIQSKCRKMRVNADQNNSEYEHFISLHSVRMLRKCGKKADQKNSEFGHFLPSEFTQKSLMILPKATNTYNNATETLTKIRIQCSKEIFMGFTINKSVLVAFYSLNAVEKRISLLFYRPTGSVFSVL